MSESASGAAGSSQQGMDPQKAMEQEQRRKQQEEARQAMLLSILSEDARARLARIRLVKPDKATAIENQLINSAKRGALPGPVQENTVVGMLEQLSKKQSETKITFKRRTIFDDEDEDDDDDV